MANEPIFMNQLIIKGTPTDPEHGVRLQDLQAIASDLRWNPVRAASDTNIAGTEDTTEKTLTAADNGELPAIDGVTPVQGDRILLFKQTNAAQNGIYEVTELGDASNPWVLTRAEDAAAPENFRPGKQVYIMPEGTKLGGQTVKQVTGTAVVVGTTPLEFAVVVDTGHVEEEIYTVTGDGTFSEYDIEHGLNSVVPTVTAYNATGNQVFFGVTVVSSSKVKITAAKALTAADGEFTIKLSAKPAVI